MAAPGTIEAQNKQTIQEAFEAWRKGTGGPFDLLAPDAHWTIVGHAAVSKTYGSRQEFMDTVILPFNARLSSRLLPGVPKLYADGNMVIALFDAEGMARDGRPYHNTYSWYMEMRDGKIVNAVAFFDSVEFNDFWARVQPQ